MRQEGRLPIQIFRPSIVVGERTTGWTPAFNVLYSPLKAFVRGSLPAVPARRSAPVDVVPVDYVADAVFELAGDPVNGTSTYHLVAGPRATSVGRLIELSARAVGQREPVVIPSGTVPAPDVSGPRAHQRQAAAGPGAHIGVLPLLRDGGLLREPACTHRLEPAGIEVPPIESYFGQLVDYADRAHWGRTPVSRAEAAADGAAGTLAAVTLAVTSYEFSLFLHITAVMVGFGATFAESIMFPVAMKLSPRHLPYVHRLQLAINQYFASPALLVVLATGIYQVSESEAWEIGDGWISATLTIVIVISALLGGYFIPADRRLGPMVQREIDAAGRRRDQVDLSPEYRRQSRMEGVVGTLVGILLIVAVYLMVTKPGV